MASRRSQRSVITVPKVRRASNSLRRRIRWRPAVSLSRNPQRVPSTPGRIHRFGDNYDRPITPRSWRMTRVHVYRVPYTATAIVTANGLMCRVPHHHLHYYNGSTVSGTGSAMDLQRRTYTVVHHSRAATRNTGMPPAIRSRSISRPPRHLERYRRRRCACIAVTTNGTIYELATGGNLYSWTTPARFGHSSTRTSCRSSLIRIIRFTFCNGWQPERPQ